MGKETKWGRRPWERSVLGLCQGRRRMVVVAVDFRWLWPRGSRLAQGECGTSAAPAARPHHPSPPDPGAGVCAHPPADGRPSCPRSLSPTGEPGLPAAPEHRGRGGAKAQVKGVALLLLRVALVVPVTASASHWSKEEQLRSLEQPINKVSR